MPVIVESQFIDDRERDLLVPANIFKGSKRLLEHLNSYNLSSVDPVAASKRLKFASPEKGGSYYIPTMCQRLAIDPRDFLTGILAEARMKSDLLELAKRTGEAKYLELSFVSQAYDFYFAAVEHHAPDYEKALTDWQEWLEGTG